jgi:uncharacterized membrane protein YcaP (DUF421 family)
MKKVKFYIFGGLFIALGSVAYEWFFNDNFSLPRFIFSFLLAVLILRISDYINNKN